MTAIEWSCLIINPQILGQCWVPPHLNIMHYARTCKLHLCSKIVQPIVASVNVPWVKLHVKIANCREAWGYLPNQGLDLICGILNYFHFVVYEFFLHLQIAQIIGQLLGASNLDAIELLLAGYIFVSKFFKPNCWLSKHLLRQITHQDCQILVFNKFEGKLVITC